MACKRARPQEKRRRWPLTGEEMPTLMVSFVTPQMGALKIDLYFQRVTGFLHFCETSLLTGWRSESIHPLTDEGGGAASDEVLRS